MSARRAIGALVVLGSTVAAVALVRERAFARSEAEFARNYPRAEPLADADDRA